jgi:hypothetical protein
MAFDFKRHLIKVQGGRTYLPVSARIVWFREEHPDWSIETEAVEINHEKQYAIFRARICDGDGKLMATGTKKEDVKGFGDYIEKSETGAVGRALALCGFGTQFAPELDEAGGGRFADSPQPMGGGRFGGGGGGGDYNGGSNGGGSNRYGGPPSGGNGDSVRFTPPREASSPRETSALPVERPASGRDGSAGQARPEAARNDAPRNNDAPRSEAARPSPVDDAGEDDFEALIGGEGLLDATEDDPFGDGAEAAPKPSTPAVRSAPPVKPEATNGTPACVGCGKALTKAQQELSIRNYGEALCPGCQRDKTRRPALAERA